MGCCLLFYIQYPTKLMNSDHHGNTSTKPPADTVAQASEHVVDEAKEACHSMSMKVEDTVVRTREYVRENPVPVLLGAVALGAALGYLMILARRPEPTFRERYVDEPLSSARDALYAALAPVAQRLHEEYSSAREVAGKAMDKVHGFHPSRAADSWSDQIRRVGCNLKFW